MSVTILRNENRVVVDGEARIVDCSTLPINVHVVQWRGEHGEVEYVTAACDHCGVRSRKPNETISDFSPYAKLLEAWHAAGPQG